MKKALLLVSLFVFAACSSTPEEKPEPAPMVEKPAPTPEPTPAPMTTTENDSMTMDSGSSDGGFPDVEGTERHGATCKSGSDERLISVIDTREGPCGVVYTKGGNKKTVAYAKNDMGFCDKVYDNILGNLTGGGFDCGGASPVSGGSEAAAEETSESSDGN